MQNASFLGVAATFSEGKRIELGSMLVDESYARPRLCQDRRRTVRYRAMRVQRSDSELDGWLRKSDIRLSHDMRVPHFLLFASDRSELGLRDRRLRHCPNAVSLLGRREICLITLSLLYIIVVFAL